MAMTIPEAVKKAMAEVLEVTEDDITDQTPLPPRGLDKTVVIMKAVYNADQSVLEEHRRLNTVGDLIRSMQTRRLMGG